MSHNVKLIALPRRLGKTEQLLNWLRSAPEGEHRILVSHNLMESHRIFRMAVDRGFIDDGTLESWQFVSVSEVVPGAWSAVLMGRGGRIVLGIDNADIVLSALLNREIGAMTVTTDE